MKTEKKILDACCGSKMMWFDKSHPDAVYMDIRKEEHELCDGRELIVNPDMIADFTQLPFEDNSFYLVVFDPPHLKSLGKNSYMAKKYGVLTYNWRDDIAAGFSECYRVLKPNGTLIFKWNEDQIKLSDVLPLLSAKPLFGHRSGKHAKTIWLTFMKSETQLGGRV